MKVFDFRSVRQAGLCASDRYRQGTGSTGEAQRSLSIHPFRQGNCKRPAKSIPCTSGINGGDLESGDVNVGSWGDGYGAF
jgi:hypothetical protein